MIQNQVFQAVFNVLSRRTWRDDSKYRERVLKLHALFIVYRQPGCLHQDAHRCKHESKPTYVLRLVSIFLVTVRFFSQTAIMYVVSPISRMIFRLFQRSL